MERKKKEKNGKTRKNVEKKLYLFSHIQGNLHCLEKNAKILKAYSQSKLGSLVLHLFVFF